MNVMQVDFSNNQNVNKLHMGDVLSLWDVARNKIIGYSTLSVYYRQAMDKDLKDVIKFGADSIVTNHIDKVQKLLKKKGYTFPAEINWENKFSEISEFNIPRTMLDDDEIAMSLRELIRMTLTIEAEALRNATDEDVRNLLGKILEDDEDAYNKVISMQQKKNWTDFPPIVLTH